MRADHFRLLCRHGSLLLQLHTDGSISVVAWYKPGIDPISWTALPNGIQSSSSNGNYSGCSGPRSGTVVLQRSTVAFHMTVSETVQCSYQATIYTSLACGASTGSISPSTATVGETYQWNTCGAGLYDLSLLNNADLVYTIPDIATSYFWRPCSNIDQSACQSVQPTTFCQAASADSNSPYSLGNGGPNVTPSPLYTLTNSGLLMQMHVGTPLLTSSCEVYNRIATSGSSVLCYHAHDDSQRASQMSLHRLCLHQYHLPLVPPQLLLDLGLVFPMLGQLRRWHTTGNVVNASYCSGADPSGSQTCSTQSCAYSWTTTAVDACSAPCGGGNHTT